MSYKISVQICSYNRKDTLEKSLKTLFAADFPCDDWEVIVVDDGSTDGTGEMVQSLSTPCRLTYIRQEKEGLSAGRNKGIRSAQGEIVLFIDDDIFADRNLLKEHWRIHETTDNCVVLGWVNHTEEPEKMEKPKFKHSDFSMSFFWTSNVSVRKKYLFEAGLFDEDFTEYGWEDLEFGHRLKKLGLTRVVNPKAVVYHYKKRWRAADLPRLCKQAESSGRSAVIYIEKRPRFSAKTSTGVFGLRIWWNDVTLPLKPVFKWLVDRSGDGPLSGLSLFAARTLVSFCYFASVKEALRKRKSRENGHE